MSGGGSGEGIGLAGLGTALALMLAPETGGASLAADGALDAGAAGAAGATDAAASAAALPLMSGFGTDALPALASGVADGIGDSGVAGVGSGLAGDFAAGVPASGLDALAAPTADAAATGAPAGASGAGGLGTWLGNPKSALQTALLANTGLSAINSLMPHKQVNVGQNAANVMNTNPSFSNPNLPQYNMQNTASPYQGNWYTYGETPQTPLYNARPTPAKRGGLMGYAQGGQVRGYAMGGQPMMPQGMTPMGAPPQAPQMPQQQSMPQQPAMPKQANPLMLAAAHKVGVAIGQHLRKNRRTPLGQVHGAGGGQDDAVPARLSQDEFVMPADITAHLGDGSSNEGAKKLKKMMHNIRQHKTSKGSEFPPKAKNPLSYLPKGSI